MSLTGLTEAGSVIFTTEQEKVSISEKIHLVRQQDGSQILVIPSCPCIYFHGHLLFMTCDIGFPIMGSSKVSFLSQCIFLKKKQVVDFKELSKW